MGSKRERKIETAREPDKLLTTQTDSGAVRFKEKGRN